MTRLLLVATTLALCACQKSPAGHYVSASAPESIHIFKDGDLFFVEWFDLKKNRTKPAFVKAVRHNSEQGWNIQGDMGQIPLALTDSGASIAIGNRKVDFVKVSDKPTETELNVDNAVVMLKTSLSKMTQALEKEKRCPDGPGYGRPSTISKPKLVALLALGEGVDIKVVDVKNSNIGSWFDEYLATGTLSFEPVAKEVETPPICLRRIDDGLTWPPKCSKMSDGGTTVSTNETSVSFSVRIALSRYPNEMFESKPIVEWSKINEGKDDVGEEVICTLLANKAFGYTEVIK